MRSLVGTLAIAAVLLLPASAAVTAERRQSFDDNWRFFKGDAPGAENPTFDDSHWRALSLPHDWAIEGPFDPKANPHTGALPIFGTGWYRKSFTVPDSLKDRYFSIMFDGAQNNAHVFLNGVEIGSRPYGYISFSVDLTSHLKFGGQTNVLAVRLSPEDHSSRWYPGAGIYRNVWLDVTGPIHVGQWGTYITTPEVTAEKATGTAKVDLRNRTGKPAAVTLQTTILDPAGKPVAKNGSTAELAAGATQTVAANLTVARPDRWDLDHPAMYTLVAEVLDANHKVVDRYTTPFGIRSIKFDREQGFLLNGRHVKIQGVCDHHDLGALGAAVNRRATERQIEILKKAGVNAIRTSHNPPSPELLDLCDRMGIVVMDESFDMWKRPKVTNGYSKYFDEWSERDVRDFVHRDRNHPSVIMWSIGNEIPEQGSPQGGDMAKRLTGFFHEEDPTRPTTSAFNSPEAAIRNHLGENVDLFGVNYRPWQYEQFQKEHPTWIVYGSETASCVSSRGVYHLPVEKYEKHPSLQLSGYDIIAPPWAYCPDVEFQYQDKLPNVLGEFVWTGFDYIGEPTPYFGGGRGVDNSKDWPARSSYFGFIDLAGFPKDRFYLYQSQWTKAPMVHMLPHWNWPGREGQAIPVMVYTNAEEVELFLNGKSLGRKKRFSEPVVIPVGRNVSPDQKFASKYRLEWQVPYAPGSLKAVAYSGGKQVAADQTNTAGPAARIKLIPDRAAIRADGDDLSFITVRVEDKDGNLVPGADNLVHFAVSGAGARRAVDNGNAASDESFQADQRKAFSGMALLIVNGHKGQPGKIHVVATSEGLAQAVTDLTAR
ncbi:MAG TPA: beta-galactosidase GalB [Candidatus Sulfopaludibacter sp.]|jgi:beta-galactosidase|nr:beta-galactosidase GalB [Candidatus Sulfopaludibacter sp.]